MSDPTRSQVLAGNLTRSALDILELGVLPLVFGLKFLRYLACHRALVAENLFLRRQLGLFLEREARPRRACSGTRLIMVLLSRLFDWRNALVIVRPETLIRWHRKGFKLLWRWKSRRGRPQIPWKLRRLIRRMAEENPLWGQERIAAELLLKLGLRISPRTVAKYMPKQPKKGRSSGQRWSTFLHNHAKAIVACDFMTTVTARFQVIYVFVVLDVGSRRIRSIGVTTHPTAAWTRKQLQQALSCEHEYRWLIHDRDSIFSEAVDKSIEALGPKVLKTPPRTPLANAHCERVIGTIRRECLDHLIPLHEKHLEELLKEWVRHYNRGRPHSSLGPGLPNPPGELPAKVLPYRHRLPAGATVTTTPVLGGLHHEYELKRAA